MDDRTPTRSDPPGDSNRSAQQKTWSTAFTTLCSIIGLLSWFLPDISLDRKILLTIVLLAAIVAVESRMAFIRERGKQVIKKIWDRRYLRVGVIGFAVTAIVAIALIFQLTATPGGPRSLSPSGPRKAAPNVTYVWNAFCAHRYLSRPADRVDPKEVAETDPDVDDPVLADDVWLDISVRRESEAELELTGIRIEEVGRNATPQTGVLVRPATGGCAEGTAQYAWRVELDEHPPAFSPVDLNTRPGEPVTRILLPYTIKAEHETFRLYFSSHGCACRFRVVLTWRHGGQETVPTALPEDGRRFFVVPRGSLPAYRVEQPSDGRYSMIQETLTPSPPSGPARDAAPDRAR